MKNGSSPRGLLLYPALLSIWLAISCAALFYADIETAMAGTMILAAVAAASLAVLSVALVWGMNIITIIVYGVMIYVLYGLEQSSIFIFVTFSAAAIGTAILAWNTSKQFLSVTKQVERDKILIDEMRINDPKTGLMRFHYARRLLSNEITRSLRYGKKLTLLLIKIQKWDELAETVGLEARESLLIEISEVLFNNCRNVDTLFINIDKIGVILPETDKEGADVITRRLIDQVEKKTKQSVRMGIVGFPEDSIAEDDLVRKAEIALKNSFDNNQMVSHYHELAAPIPDIEPEIVTKSLHSVSINHPDEMTPKKAISSQETSVHFCGIHTMSDIELLQSILNKIPEIGTIRLIDFSENEITFAIGTERIALTEKLLTKLEISNITIEERMDSIVVKLDPSIPLIS
jgi:GGDEF domain-containing protein